jgi:hypothetical protein
MSNINEAKKNLKSKLSLQDFGIPVGQQDIMTASQSTSAPATQHNSNLAEQHASKIVDQPAVKTVTLHSDKPSSQQTVETACLLRDKPAMQHTDKTSKRQVVKPVSQQDGKLKATYYLDADARFSLTEMYIKQLKELGRSDRSAIVCEAIKLLYKKQIK